MASTSYIPPSQIPSARAEQLGPILQRLLECPRELLSDLSSQCASAIADLPDGDRPESFEGLLDVARFCVEDEPGWEPEQRAKFIGGHPRIGAPLSASTAELSEESRKEQLKGGQADPATLQRLAKLNALYEARYPGLRFVTYVAGRSRAAVADELAENLGTQIANLASASDLPANEVRSHQTDEWQAELERASDALWEIAADRAGKLTVEVTQQQSDSTNVAARATTQPSATPATIATAATNASEPSEKQAGEAAQSDGVADAAATQPSQRPSATQPEAVGQDVPFLSLAAFRMLVLSSPVLESFFESDLTPSFYLEPVERSQSGGAYAWHTAPSLPGAPRAVPGASSAASASAKEAWAASEASYSRDVTTGARGKVVGFLGGLLGEEGKARMNAIADQVGQRLQTHTVSGPKPSFGRKETLDGGRMDTQELREKEAEERRKANEERKNTLGSRLASALRAPARATAAASAAATTTLAGGSGTAAETTATSSTDERGRTAVRTPQQAKDKAQKRMSLRGTDLSTTGPMGAAESLRAAQAALVEERPAFVIDEVGANGEEEEEEEEEGEEGELGEGAEEVVGAAIEDQPPGEGLLRGKEAQMAKELREAEPH